MSQMINNLLASKDSARKQILDIRVELNITQQELSDMINVNITTVAMWECGRRQPSVSSIKKISNMYWIQTNFG